MLFDRGTPTFLRLFNVCVHLHTTFCMFIIVIMPILVSQFECVWMTFWSFCDVAARAGDAASAGVRVALAAAARSITEICSVSYQRTASAGTRRWRHVLATRTRAQVSFRIANHSIAFICIDSANVFLLYRMYNAYVYVQELFAMCFHGNGSCIHPRRAVKHDFVCLLTYCNVYFEAMKKLEAYDHVY